MESREHELIICMEYEKEFYIAAFWRQAKQKKNIWTIQALIKKITNFFLVTFQNIDWLTLYLFSPL